MVSNQCVYAHSRQSYVADSMTSDGRNRIGWNSRTCRWKSTSLDTTAAVR